jgi:hypothetical protein
MNTTNKDKQTTKRQAKKPVLKKLGKVTKLTLKTGSQTDFGTGRFNP